MNLGHWLSMDGLLHLVHKEGTGRAAAPPSPLLVYQNNSPPVNGQPITVGLLLYSGRCCAFLTYSLKAAFHYYSQLQIWSKTWSQAGRKHVESQLRTCLKRVFFLHSICLARARSSELVGVRDQVFDKKLESWSKPCRKPART